MENKYIDINKGFHRVGNFSPFDDEIYKSLDEARKYANGGGITTSAYPGQLIKVLLDEEPKVFLIDNNFKLVSISETISTNSKLSIQFDYNSSSGDNAVAISLPAGFLLNKITIKIEEPFPVGSKLSIGKYVAYSGNNIGIEYLIDSDLIMIDGEPDDEFVFGLTESLSEKTTLYLFLEKGPVPEGTTGPGKGIVKIN